MAEREREGAHHPQALGDAEQREALSATRPVVVASNERISIGSFGGGARAAGRSGVPRRPLGHPLLARAEVVDVAEDDVVHRRAVGDRDREREERDPALRVDRAVDRVDDDARRGRPRRRRARRAPRRRAEVGLEASSRATTASSAAASIAVVSSPPSPRRSTGSRSTRVGSSREHDGRCPRRSRGRG